MRRLASITALALALTAAPLSLAATAGAAAPPGTTAGTTAGPAAVAAPADTAPPGWVYYAEYPALWICQYEGNQLIAAHTYQNYECLAGHPGQLALWVLPY